MARAGAIITSVEAAVFELLGEAGALAPPGDARAFATRLDGLLRDPARRAALGAAARQRAEARYTLDRMVDDFAMALSRL